MFFSHFRQKNVCFSATSARKTYVFQLLPPKKRTFFSQFPPKNVCFSATSAQKTYVFQPLLPKKRMFFSQFRPKNVRFSASSPQKTYVFQPVPPEKRMFFIHFHPKNVCFFSQFRPKNVCFVLKNVRFSASSLRKTYVFQPVPLKKIYCFQPVPPKKTHVFQPLPPEKRTKLTTIERFFSSEFSRDFRTEISCFVPILRKIPVEWTKKITKKETKNRHHEQSPSTRISLPVANFEINPQSSWIQMALLPMENEYRGSYWRLVAVTHHSLPTREKKCHGDAFQADCCVKMLFFMVQ